MAYIFAGNISVSRETQVASLVFPWEWKYSITERPDRNTIYLHWTTYLVGSKELLWYIQTLLGELLSFDISHTGDNGPDMIELFTFPDWWNYTYLVVHWEDFQSVCCTYRKHEWVVSIRTAEESKNLWGKIIKIDIIA